MHYRHAAELFGHNVTRNRDFSKFSSMVDRARKSNLTFHSRSGGSKTIAHLARVDNNMFVVVHFHTEGNRAGTLASIWSPSQKQLSSYLGSASRYGP